MQDTAFPALVDTLVHRFCAACDALRLAYVQISRPPKPPALIEPRTTDRRGPPPPTRQDLLRLAHVLRYVHVLRKRRQSVAVADLARAISQDGNNRPLSTSFLRKCPYLSVTSRRFRGDRLCRPYVGLKVNDPWQTLADVIDALADPHGGHTDVDTLKEVFYALCPAFNRRLPKGIPTLHDFLTAFPGTFDTSTPGTVRCLAPFDNPDPEVEIARYRHDVHTPEDLDAIISLANAAMTYPRPAVSRAAIPVEDLYAWGRNSQPPLPCWQSPAGFRQFLRTFRHSRYYRLTNDRVRIDFPYRPQARINTVRTAIHVLADRDGYASCEAVARVLNRSIPGFRAALDAGGLVAYVRGLKSQPFVLDGETRLTERYLATLPTRFLHADLASHYYPRYLAKRQAVADGLARLRRLAAGEPPPPSATYKLVHATATALHAVIQTLPRFWQTVSRPPLKTLDAVHDTLLRQRRSPATTADTPPP